MFRRRLVTRTLTSTNAANVQDNGEVGQIVVKRANGTFGAEQPPEFADAAAVAAAIVAGTLKLGAVYFITGEAVLRVAQ